MKRIKVGIIFGGKSAEHEISLQSAKNIIAALDPNKYEPVLIGIDKQGQWFLGSSSKVLMNNPGQLLGSKKVDKNIALTAQSQGAITNLKTLRNLTVDVIFPVLHGPMGEDGTIQGLLKLANVAFVGAGVLGSAIGMDKDVMKRLLRDAKIPTAQFLVIRDHVTPTYSDVVKKIGTPFFVKPVNLGSSIGVSKVTNEADFQKAVDQAFRYDRKVLLEEYIQGRELECAVLGNENPIASVPGEVISQHEFYSYEAKYIDENGAILKIPARINDQVRKAIQAMAVKAFQVLECEGMARVDFFLRSNNEILVNEINTIPGFTSISMYPKLWEASGISYRELIDRLIQLAQERFTREQRLKSSYQ